MNWYGKNQKERNTGDRRFMQTLYSDRTCSTHKKRKPVISLGFQQNGSAGMRGGQDEGEK